MIVPVKHQSALPLDRLILREPPDDEAMPLDVLFVGAGPAGLAGAIRLAQLVRKDAEAGGNLGEIEIGVLEKAASLGEHNMSGAVINPAAFRADIGKIHPMARTGKPEEVAALVAFLAAEESGFVTGQIYTVDGGRMAKLSLP